MKVSIRPEERAPINEPVTGRLPFRCLAEDEGESVHRAISAVPLCSTGDVLTVREKSGGPAAYEQSALYCIFYYV